MTPPLPLQRVHVFSLVLPAPGTAKDARRYRVKWRVDGRDRTRSFKTRAEAERLRSRLQVAVTEGVPFDPDDGVPTSWLPAPTGATWWDWSREWMRLKWPQWSGHSRRSAAETLCTITPLMARAGAPRPPAGLAKWLRRCGYLPDSSQGAPEPSWLREWSVPLSQIDAGLIEHVLHAITTKANGESTVASVSRRRSHLLGSVLRSAVRRGVLAADPMARVEWRVPATTLAVNVSTVPSPDDVADVVDLVAGLPGDGARYAALFAAIGLGGMRPSEAAGLLTSDLRLPARGWGLATVRGAITNPGTLYTATGEAVERKGLKHRAAVSVREVPLAPPLVERLRWHVGRWASIEGRVFSTRVDRPLTVSAYGPVWGRAREVLWPAGHALAEARVYDLRHSAATMMLRAGVPPAEVARRLGHSVDVLMRVYAGVFLDERDRSNELIEEMLGSGRAGRG